MKILIDLQGAQSPGSRNRGIGRYSLAIAHAIARNKGEEEVIVALNGNYPETIPGIIDSFNGVLPVDSFSVFRVPEDVAALSVNTSWRRTAAELVREAFLESLCPDVIVITSLFEGCSDNIVTSIGRFNKIPTAVIAYDLIPLIYKSKYLENPLIEEWYHEKLGHLRRAHMSLTISDSTKQELINILGSTHNNTISIGTDAESMFSIGTPCFGKCAEISIRHGLTRNYIMYTGGIDERKNIGGLIRAFSLLDSKLRKQYQLAIVCKLPPAMKARLLSLSKALGLKESEVVLTGFVEDTELVDLYRMCSLFVFPSWHEGFGLPVLEAIRCGAPVIGSNISSIPEVIGIDDALFDPHNAHSIASLMERVLSDNNFKLMIKERERLNANHFSWDASGRLAIQAIRSLRNSTANEQGELLLSRLIQALIDSPAEKPSRDDLAAISETIDANFPPVSTIQSHHLN